MRFTPARKWIYLGLCLLGLALYWQALSNAFVFDDEEQIVANSVIHSLENIPGIFTQSTMNSGGAAKLSGVYYKPLMTSAYALLWAIAGNSPFVFHLFQLMVHILNALLIFRFLDFFTERVFKSVWIPLFSALIFLVHPMNVECVVYSADLQDVLFLFFGMTSLVLCVMTARLDYKRTLALVLLLLCSLLSKESGALFLPLLPLFLFLFRREWWRRGAVASVIAGSIYAFLRLGVAELVSVRQDVVQIGRASLGLRLLTIPKSLGHYFLTFFYPSVITTAQDWVVREATWVEFWLPLLVFGGIFVIAGRYFLRKKDPVLLFFSAWVLLGLGLHMNLVPLDATVADRWFYFPMVGLLGVLAVLFMRLRGGWAGNVLSLVLPVVLLAALSVRSFVRSQDWVDGFTLYSHDLQFQPDSYYLTNNYGVELFRKGRVQEAKEYFEKSTQLAPHWFTNWNNLGATYEALGDLDRAEQCYLRSLNTSLYYLAYENYAKILLVRGKHREARDFIMNTALPAFPDNPWLKAMLQASPQ